MSPVTCAGALASIKFLRKHNELRQQHQERSNLLRDLLLSNDIPVMSTSTTHIIPVLVGNSEKCKKASDALLNDHDIYVQPINWPTVDIGTERLRFAPTPLHDDEMMHHLVKSLKAVLN
jgi:5-aminolevulinate synthase